MNFLRSRHGDEPLVVEGTFGASVERVYRAWTEPGEVVKWFGASPHSLVAAEIDLRIGGEWRFVLSEADDRIVCFRGEYEEIAPNRKLVFTWRHVVEKADGARQETPSSRVSVMFEPVTEGTRVRLHHEGIQSRDGRLGVGSGWEASFGALADAVRHS